MLTLILALLIQEPAAPLSPGETLYNFRCKACHEPGQPGIPNLAALRALSPETVVRSLERGNMKVMGSNLTPEEKRQIAAFVAGRP